MPRAAALSSRKTLAVSRSNGSNALRLLVRQAGNAAQLLKLMGNEKRLLIMCFLSERGEMAVGELAEAVDLSQSALSQHLAKMRADRLVEFRRDAQTLYYRVSDTKVLQVLQVLKKIYCSGLR